MAIRFNDVPYHTFSFWSDMVVVCPVCAKAAVVRFDTERSTVLFKCGACYTKKESASYGARVFEATAQCTSTGRYFRTSISEYKVHGQKAKVKCPYCKESVIGNISYAASSQYPVFQDIRHAEDPYFHFPLYFQANYRGKTIWALNREHLQYLIDYLTADIRTVRYDFRETNKTMRSQSDMLPAFMKTAKNRKHIVKLLTKLQNKE